MKIGDIRIGQHVWELYGGAVFEMIVMSFAVKSVRVRRANKYWDIVGVYTHIDRLYPTEVSALEAHLAELDIERRKTMNRINVIKRAQS